MSDPSDQSHIVSGPPKLWRDSKIQAMADRIAELEARNAELVGQLEELREYFDQRADADYQGDEDGFVGNAEMHHLSEIDATLAKANQS